MNIISESDNYLLRNKIPVKRQQSRFIVFMNFKDTSSQFIQCHGESFHASMKKQQKFYRITGTYRFQQEKRKSSFDEHDVMGDFLKSKKYHINDTYDLILQRNDNQNILIFKP